MKEEIDGGGSAFPCEQGHTPDGAWNQSFDPGMTLRDYFAAKALLCAMGSGWEFDGKPVPAQVAADFALMAYQMADAMLKARPA